MNVVNTILLPKSIACPFGKRHQYHLFALECIPKYSHPEIQFPHRKQSITYRKIYIKGRLRTLFEKWISWKFGMTYSWWLVLVSGGVCTIDTCSILIHKTKLNGLDGLNFSLFNSLNDCYYFLILNYRWDFLRVSLIRDRWSHKLPEHSLLVGYLCETSVFVTPRMVIRHKGTLSVTENTKWNTSRRLIQSEK